MIKIVKSLIICFILIPSLAQAMVDGSSNFAALSRQYVSGNRDVADTNKGVLSQQKNDAANQYLNAAALNNLLASTPDSVKSAIIEKIPDEYKGYLVRFIEFIKSFFSSDQDKTTTLDSIKSLLEKNSAESQVETPAQSEGY